MAAATPTEARTWRVFENGSGDAPTIQAAIDSAATADSILIHPGTYDENLDTNGKGLTLRGTTDPSLTIVDAGARGRVLSMDNGCVVERLTLRNGSDGLGQNGAGIYMQGSGPAIIRGNIIESNTTPGVGGGMYLDVIATEDIVIEANVVRFNVAGGGGGLVLGNSAGGRPRLYVRENLIYSNDSGDSAGGVFAQNAQVTNNIIAANRAEITGGGAELSGSGEFSNNTVAYNQTTNLGPNGAGIFAGGSVTITNNLIVGNYSAQAGEGIRCFENTPQCNLLWDNDIDLNSCTADPSNVSQDPQFCAVDPLYSLNFTIQSDSPAAPGQSACGLIGAQPVGCGTTATLAKTWSGLKQIYR